MSVFRKTRLLQDYFDRAQTYTATPGYKGWTSKLTKTAGSPTSANITADGGAAQLATDNTSEAQILSLYQNDILFLPAGQKRLHFVSWLLSVSGIDAVTTMVAGLATAENDAIASVTNAAWFKILGSSSTSNVVIDTKDGTNTQTSVATGITLSTTPKLFTIDFQQGLSDVRFYIDGQRVAAGTTFNLSALGSTQNLQPYLQIGKASGTGTPLVKAYYYAHQYNEALGV